MSHGAPDFGQYRRESVTFPVLDLAELAVRLGSIVSYDRRGDVLWMDDFETNLGGWNQSKGGTGAAIALTSTTRFRGASCVACTGGSDGARKANLARNLPAFSVNKAGVAVLVAFDANVDYVEVDLSILNTVKTYASGIRYDPSTTKLSILTGVGTYTVIATISELWANLIGFHYFKLVADLASLKYTRALVNALSYDLSAYSMVDYGATVDQYIAAELNMHSNSGVNGVVYWDDVIVTQNEP